MLNSQNKPRRPFKTFLLCFFPLVVTVFVLMPVYGALKTWEVGSEVLKNNYPDSKAIAIAVGNYYKTNDGLHDYKQWQYLIFGKEKKVRVITVIETIRGDEVEIEVTESLEAAFVYLMLILLITIVAVKWWYPTIFC